MQKSDTDELAEDAWSSPTGEFAGADKQVAAALGRQLHSADSKQRPRFGGVKEARFP